MDYETRCFVLVEEKIHQIGVERLEQLYNGVVPEYAGQKIPYALLLFERENDELKDLRCWRGSYLIFDKKGKADQDSSQRLIELSLTSARGFNSFIRRRADQIRRENTWHPTGEQLNQMIALSKGKADVVLT